MATLVLGAVGSALGAGFGGAILGFSGAAIGGFIGSTIGSVVDNWIVSSLAPAQRIEGARLDSLHITSSTEGAVIPRLFGRMRIGGNIIWATDFREEVNTTSQGGGNPPMADTTDRGITINGTLAWTMLVSVAGLIWWGGGTLASLQGAAERLTAALMETREMILAERASSAQLEARVRVLETGAARQDARFDALSASIDELKQQARQTNDLLRDLTQRP